MKRPKYGIMGKWAKVYRPSADDLSIGRKYHFAGEVAIIDEAGCKGGA